VWDRPLTDYYFAAERGFPIPGRLTPAEGVMAYLAWLKSWGRRLAQFSSQTIILWYTGKLMREENQVEHILSLRPRRRGRGSCKTVAKGRICSSRCAMAPRVAIEVKWAGEGWPQDRPSRIGDVGRLHPTRMPLSSPAISLPARLSGCGEHDANWGR